MTLLVIVMLMLVCLAGLAAHHHHHVVAWHRELDLAFGTDSAREFPRHGRL
jgi:hypothetical protein